MANVIFNTILTFLSGFITARKRNLGQGNIFQKHLSDHMGGGLCLWSHVPSDVGGSLSGGLPAQKPPPTETPPLDRDLTRYGKERVVRILLECILVRKLTDTYLCMVNITS